MRYCKLTDTYGYTCNAVHWAEGTTHVAEGMGSRLCSGDVIHVYDHPLKAVMFNPIHANFTSYILWKVKVRKIVADDGLKVGAKQVTTLEKMEAPIITVNQKVRFAIYSALEVYNRAKFVSWANKWLSSEDRSAAAANAASYVTADVVVCAVQAAAAAVHAADAADAAYAAANAAPAAVVAAYAANTAACAANTAACAAASCAAAKSKSINFLKLIKKAIEDEDKNAILR